jgi:hypothetical protein
MHDIVIHKEYNEKKKKRFPLVGYNDKRHVIKGYDKVDNYII